MARLEGDAALVAIAVEEETAFAAFSHRTDFAIFATRAALDSDDVGAKVRKHHRAVRSGDETPKVDDSNSFKKPAHNAQHPTVWSCVFQPSHICKAYAGETTRAYRPCGNPTNASWWIVHTQPTERLTNTGPEIHQRSWWILHTQAT